MSLNVGGAEERRRGVMAVRGGEMRDILRWMLHVACVGDLSRGCILKTRLIK